MLTEDVAIGSSSPGHTARLRRYVADSSTISHLCTLASAFYLYHYYITAG